MDKDQSQKGEICKGDSADTKVVSVSQSENCQKMTRIQLVIDTTIDITDSERLSESIKSNDTFSLTVREGNTEKEHNFNGFDLIVTHLIKMNVVISELSIKRAEKPSANEEWLKKCVVLLNYAKSQIQKLKIDLSISATSEMLKLLSESLKELEQVSVLKLVLGKNVVCKGKHIGRFFKALWTKSQLKNIYDLTIDVRGIHLGHANSRDVIELAIINGRNLKNLNLCLAGCSIQKKGMEALKKLLIQMKQANHINIDVSENALVDSFFKDFFRAFWMLPAETPLVKLELNLYENYFGAETAENFYDSTKNFAVLKNIQHFSLFLGKNSISDQLASQITQGILLNLPKLKSCVLDFSNSREKMESLPHLDEQLRQSVSLEDFTIDLRSNIGLHKTMLQSLIDSVQQICTLPLKNLTIIIDNPPSDFDVKKDFISVKNSVEE